jgi:hypothetical protein
MIVASERALRPRPLRRRIGRPSPTGTGDACRSFRRFRRRLRRRERRASAPISGERRTRQRRGLEPGRRGSRRPARTERSGCSTRMTASATDPPRSPVPGVRTQLQRGRPPARAGVTRRCRSSVGSSFLDDLIRIAKQQVTRRLTDDECRQYLHQPDGCATGCDGDGGHRTLGPREARPPDVTVGERSADYDAAGAWSFATLPMISASSSGRDHIGQ